MQNKLNNLLAVAGLSKAQDLAGLEHNPISLPPSSGADTPGLFKVTSWGKPLHSFLSSDKSASLVELIKVTSNDPLTISLVPLSKGTVTAKFNGKTITFKSGKTKEVSVSIFAPSKPGRYLLTTASSPIPLAIDVTALPPQTPTKPASSGNWFSGAKDWFSTLFH